MEKSSFFNDIDNDRIYDALDFAEYFATFIGNGVFAVGENLHVIADHNMAIKLKTGKAWINGYYYHNTTDLILNVPLADGAKNRRDSVVLRWSNQSRDIKAVVKTGVAVDGVPQPPALTRTGEIYELELCTIMLNKGVINVRQQDIQDTRANKAVCGLVHATIDQIDSTVIFKQFEDWYEDKQKDYNKNIEKWTSEKQALHEKWTSEKQAAFVKWYAETTKSYIDKIEDFLNLKNGEFNKWFDDIKSKLNIEIATKLSKEILTEEFGAINSNTKYYSNPDIKDGFATDLRINGRTINNLIDNLKCSGAGSGEPSVTTDRTGGCRVANTKEGSCVMFLKTEQTLENNTEYTIYAVAEDNGGNAESRTLGCKVSKTNYLGDNKKIISKTDLNNMAEGITFTTATTGTVEGITLGFHENIGAKYYMYLRHVMLFKGNKDKINPLEFIPVGLHSLGEKGGLKINSCNRNMAILNYAMIQTKSAGFSVDVSNYIVNCNNTEATTYQNVAFNLFLKPNTQYVLRAKRMNRFGDKNCSITVKSDADSFNYAESLDDIVNRAFTTRNETKFRLHIYNTLSVPELKGLSYTDIEIVEVSKDNGTFTRNCSDYILLKNVELRTFDELYGNTIKRRSMKLNLDGSEDWFFYKEKQDKDTVIFALYNATNHQATEINNVICNRFINRNVLDNVNSNKEGIFLSYNGTLFVSILRSKLLRIDIGDFKAWLKTNPLELVCATENIMPEIYRSKSALATYVDGTIFIADPCHNYFNLRVPKTVLAGLQNIVDRGAGGFRYIEDLDRQNKELTEQLEIINKDVTNNNNSISNVNDELKTVYKEITGNAKEINTASNAIATIKNALKTTDDNISLVDKEVLNMKDDTKIYKEDAQTLITQLLDKSKLIIKAQQTALSKYSMPSGKTVRFDSAFPNVCLQVVACGNYDYSTSIEYHGLPNVSVFDVDKEGFSFNGDGASDKWYSIRWIAIGY